MRRTYLRPYRCYICGRFLSSRLEKWRGRWYFPHRNSTEYVVICDSHELKP